MSLAPVSLPDDSLLVVSVDVPAGRVRLAGELDSGSVHLLAEALLMLAATPRRTWTLDLGGVGFCDSDGLTGLLRARREALDAGRSLVLERTSRSVRRIVELTGTADLLALRHASPAVAG